MTEQQHPITPPKHLLSHWTEVINYGYSPERIEEMLTEAARWGANEELEACCEWLVAGPWHIPDASLIKDLRLARRPKPPSLKEQALQALNEVVYMADDIPPEGICTEQADIIRRAIEALPD